MPIDPRIAKKYTGSTGDPYDKMGAALAGMDAKNAANKEAAHRARMAGRVPVGMGGPGAMLKLLFLRPKAFAVLFGLIVIIVVTARVL